MSSIIKKLECLQISKFLRFKMIWSSSFEKNIFLGSNFVQNVGPSYKNGVFANYAERPRSHKRTRSRTKQAFIICWNNSPKKVIRFNFQFRPILAHLCHCQEWRGRSLLRYAHTISFVLKKNIQKFEAKEFSIRTF